MMSFVQNKLINNNNNKFKKKTRIDENSSKLFTRNQVSHDKHIKLTDKNLFRLSTSVDKLFQFHVEMFLFIENQFELHFVVFHSLIKFNPMQTIHVHCSFFANSILCAFVYLFFSNLFLYFCFLSNLYRSQY